MLSKDKTLFIVRTEKQRCDIAFREERNQAQHPCEVDLVKNIVVVNIAEETTVMEEKRKRNAFHSPPMENGYIVHFLNGKWLHYAFK